MEFDINVAEQVWKEEALEKGREMGRAEGRREGEERGRRVGRQEGRAEGWQEGSQKKQNEILELMNRVESMEDFKRLRERLADGKDSTRGV
ncbi:MAG: hypothetical protein LBG87_00620, partial [Spirochaetaceae bacterium]|jgi:flagellar biosynthesis/type III secretory pathway protein FliH|nr:hypothetical protein [Spirochaetaceae bacterium]